MHKVEFENESIPQRIAVKERPSLIVRMIMKCGVSDLQKVNYILLTIAIFFFGLSTFLFLKLKHSDKDLNIPLTEEQKAFIQRTQ